MRRDLSISLTVVNPLFMSEMVSLFFMKVSIICESQAFILQHDTV